MFALLSYSATILSLLWAGDRLRGRCWAQFLGVVRLGYQPCQGDFQGGGGTVVVDGRNQTSMVRI